MHLDGRYNYVVRMQTRASRLQSELADGAHSSDRVLAGRWKLIGPRALFQRAPSWRRQMGRAGDSGSHPARPLGGAASEGAHSEVREAPKGPLPARLVSSRLVSTATATNDKPVVV